MWVWDWDDCYVSADEEEGEEAKYIGTPDLRIMKTSKFFSFLRLPRQVAILRSMHWYIYTNL